MNKCPVFPDPSKRKFSIFKFLFKKNRSWLDVLKPKSYKMKMGKMALPNHKVFILNDAKEVKRLMVQEPNAFPKNKVYHEALESLLGETAFTTNGQQWKHQRKLLLPAFRKKRLESGYKHMLNATEAMLTRLKVFNADDVIDMEFEMKMVTSDIIFRSMFTRSLDQKEATNILNAFKRYQDYSPLVSFFKVGGFEKYFFYKWLFKKRDHQKKVVRAYLDKVVERRFTEFAEGIAYDDMLQDIFEVAQAAEQDYSLEEMTNQMALLFLAGHETSATSLVWTLYLLAQFSEDQHKVFDEVLSIRSQGAFSSEDLKKLEYLKMVFMESLRLYPPVGLMSRQPIQRSEIRGSILNKEDAIVIAPWLIHRSENYWEDPNEFCPARFESGDPSERGAYLPFGLGQRMCIGMGFAEQEALLILATLVREYKIELAPGFEPEVVGKITLRSENGLQVILRPRG